MMRFVRPAAVMAALLLGACTHTFEVPQSTLAKSAATAERSDAVAALGRNARSSGGKMVGINDGRYV